MDWMVFDDWWHTKNMGLIGAGLPVLFEIRRGYVIVSLGANIKWMNYLGSLEHYPQCTNFRTQYVVILLSRWRCPFCIGLEVALPRAIPLTLTNMRDPVLQMTGASELTVSLPSLTHPSINLKQASLDVSRATLYTVVGLRVQRDVIAIWAVAQPETD
jgi:hypothetical protein